MKSYLKDHTDEIGGIAILLADNFAKTIHSLSGANSYSEYLKGLKEILKWSHEFYLEYNCKLNDWESFKRCSDNIYLAVNQEDFLIAWGKDRIKRFIDEHPENKATEFSPGKTGKQKKLKV